MPFNGSGVFQRVRNWVADAAAGIKIRADFHDAEDDNLAAGLTNCITKDGQTIITQNIPFNSKRITGLADPVNPQDASTKAYADTKLSGTGNVTMPGDLTINKDAPVFILNDTDAAGSTIKGQHAGKDRWVMHLGNADPESTGNAGSNFDLIRYDDAGTAALGTVLKIDRATGLGVVEADPTAPLGIATKQYIDAKITALPAPDPQLFAGIPINPQAAYTTVATDAQKCIMSSGGAIIINSSLYTAGTVITFASYGTTITINVNAGSMYWCNASGAVASGVRTLPNVGIATAIKLPDGNWIIAGNGLK